MSLPGILGGFETRQKQIFHIFGTREKIRNFFSRKNRDFSVKIGILSENIGFYRKNRRFFFPDFSTAKSFPGPPISDFSPENRPISAIFLSLHSTDNFI